MDDVLSRDRRLRWLVGGRFAVGGTALVAPRLAGRIVGIDPRANPAAPFVGRLFGVRAVGMGFAVAIADGTERDRQLRGGIAVDLIDAAAALAAARSHELNRRAAALAFAAALTEAALGASLLSARAALPVSGDRPH